MPWTEEERADWLRRFNELREEINAHSDMLSSRQQAPCCATCPACAEDLNVSLKEVATLWEAKEAVRIAREAERKAHFARCDARTESARALIEELHLGFERSGGGWMAWIGDVSVGLYLQYGPGAQAYGQEWPEGCWAISLTWPEEDSGETCSYWGPLEEVLRKASLPPEELLKLARAHWYVPPEPWW